LETAGGGAALRRRARGARRLLGGGEAGGRGRGSGEVPGEQPVDRPTVRVLPDDDRDAAFGAAPGDDRGAGLPGAAAGARGGGGPFQGAFSRSRHPHPRVPDRLHLRQIPGVRGVSHLLSHGTDVLGASSPGGGDAGQLTPQEGVWGVRLGQPEVESVGCSRAHAVWPSASSQIAWTSSRVTGTTPSLRTLALPA